jgi:hypothetical protein
MYFFAPCPKGFLDSLPPCPIVPQVFCPPAPLKGGTFSNMNKFWKSTRMSPALGGLGGRNHREPAGLGGSNHREPGGTEGSQKRILPPILHHLPQVITDILNFNIYDITILIIHRNEFRVDKPGVRCQV